MVRISINGEDVDLSMTLDNEGRGYFSTKTDAKKEYRFWTALLGVRDPDPKHRTDTATSDQLGELGLVSGVNSIVYTVETSSGSVVTSQASVHLVSEDTKIVITDIDGTVTKSDVRGVILPWSDPASAGIVRLETQGSGEAVQSHLGPGLPHALPHQQSHRSERDDPQLCVQSGGGWSAHATRSSPPPGRLYIWSSSD